MSIENFMRLTVCLLYNILQTRCLQVQMFFRNIIIFLCKLTDKRFRLELMNYLLYLQYWFTSIQAVACSSIGSIICNAYIFRARDIGVCTFLRAYECF